VTFRVRRRDGGEPLVPLGVPSEQRAIACWTATEGVAVAIVDATDEMAARGCRGTGVPRVGEAARREGDGRTEAVTTAATASRVPFSTTVDA
jgi:hypothetical protein